MAESAATTDSDHGHPIFRNLAKDKVVDGANQLWVADITYVAADTGFVCVAVILDAWSRRVVGYALSRSIDVRLGNSRVVIGTFSVELLAIAVGLFSAL